MSAWRLDEAEGVRTRPAAGASAKRAFFPDGDATDQVRAADAPNGGLTRRKKVGWGSELVIDDAADGREEHPRGPNADETAKADVVESADDLEALVHHLVRSHLLVHGQSDVVALLDLEKPCPALSASKLQRLQQHLIHGDSGASESLLERFLHAQTSLSPSRSSSRRPGKETLKTAERARESSRSKTGSSSRRKKPTLNVVTSDDSVGDASPGAGEDEQGFNRLNHPGSTPRASEDPASAIMGEPGSTPMARAKDLAALGFDDFDGALPTLQEPPREPTSPPDAQPGNRADAPSELSQYALAKRAANKHNKRVRLGEPGSTPTKEYVFFRETPPQFVTESVEAAVEVFAALGNDPTFRAPVVDKLVELQSSDVGKYRVGQRVEGLGAQRAVSGVVSKVFGSRQCGSSGPGTIVVDTSPEEEEEAGEAAGST